MGKTITNECVDCGLPCLGDACPFRHVVRWHCVECQEEFSPDELYLYEDEETLCQDCLLEKFKTVAQMGGGYE